ncbi:rho guanine nucleotide exchange factor 18 isoform X2 [Engraulis encrasicolus]|uniref:rho guanine nucleotide exchange factor 18 isoform X2 n=1 Tax=Engraulis encrasicolus TaxID=184585 RepID=UPI002FD1996D
MADSPLNNSWPSFSKLWMKRWSFKRGSEGKPCVPPANLDSGIDISSSLSPSSIPEDVFFNSLTEEQSPSSTESDYENPGEQEVASSSEDLLDFNPSLRDSEFFRDLHPPPDHTATAQTHKKAPPTPTTALSIVITPVGEHSLSPTLHVYQIVDQGGSGPEPPVTSALCQAAAAAAPWHFSSSNSSNMENQHGDSEQPTVTVNTTVQLGDPEEPHQYLSDSDADNIPMLVRSLSTSRRHSWDAPISPIDLGRRLSLDTTAMDSDGEESILVKSKCGQHFVYPECSEDEGHDNDFQQEKSGDAGRRQSDVPDGLASDERSRAAHVSRILETSSQAAKASGEEQDLGDRLQSEEGQSHLTKHRSRGPDERESSSNVTWFEFLANENEEDEDKTEKSERGAKVKRTLSSLRNRMTGSFNKDKGKTREKDREQQQREKDKDREKEREEKEREKVRRRSSSGHQLVPGSFSSWTTCTLCSKTLQQRKHGLQCQNCGVNVHKSCKSLLAECSGNKHKFRESVKSSGSAQTAIKDHPSSTTTSHHHHHHYQQQTSQSPPQSSQQQSWAADGSCRPPRPTGMTITPRGPAAAATSNSSLSHCNSSGSLPGEMDEADAGRLKRLADDTVSLAPSTTDSIIVDDAYYAAVRGDLEADAQDFEQESWSQVVDQPYLKAHSKETLKRQDVIYELIQTEVHHVRTLKTMLRVYLHELRDSLQSQERRLFPRLESLLELHVHFLSRLKERRSQSMQPGSERNYTMRRVGDILVSQFSGESGERMKECYGDFCSRHSEAVSFYKEQLQTNKKFQSQIRKISNLSIVRRLGIPECILLVTQRITKYPVLVERILHNTEAGSEEHEDLTRALGLIKEVITQVDTQVNDYEKASRLRDIAAKLEPKSHGKIKDGRVFRREDLCQGRRKLLHHGTVNWKAASGRLKDILAVLLTDVLLLLQEKDQRLVFSTVDNKPSVISLQKLIVREVAHEEKAMFLICASSNEPEMYEIHTTSKEERNVWMTHIRQAVESCPTTEERLFSEEEEARAVRFKEFHDRLSAKDSQISQILGEKLELFADMVASVGGAAGEDLASRSRLLLRGDTSSLQQGEHLLKGAITEVENLQNLLLSNVREQSPRSETSQQGSGGEDLPSPRSERSQQGSGGGDLPSPRSERSQQGSGGGDLPSPRSERSQQGSGGGDLPSPRSERSQQGSGGGDLPSPRSESSQQVSGGSGALPRRADTFGGYDSSPSAHQKNGGVKKANGGLKSRERSQRASSDPQIKELGGTQALEESVDGPSPASWNPSWTQSFPEAEQFLAKVLQLSQKLYSLQAIVAQQDSHLELQRASLSERERPGGGRHRLANVLLEQEKQRNLEKQREELASFHKLQSQHRQEQARWERERERHRRHAEVAEGRLQQREDECRRLETRLAEEREELERQRQTYQEDLERLRESTRTVEREKERLEHQKKLKKHNTLPSVTSASAMFTGQETGQHQHIPLSTSFNGEMMVDPVMQPKTLVRSSLSISPADYPERPEVKVAVVGAGAKGSEVPIHLISTTNQLHKQGSVQQQIPTKLAALSRGKEKSSKGKSSHRTDSSASLDMKQMLPLKLSARDDSSLRAKRSISPIHHSQIHIQPPEPVNHPPELHYESPPPAPPHHPPPHPPQPHPQPAHLLIPHSRPPSQVQIPVQVPVQSLPPPPYKPLTEDISKEDVIFF